MQKEAYEFLVEILLSEQINMENKALVVCELSKLSNNPFDAGSPYNKRQWKQKHLKIDEICKWREAGYPDGNGYEVPLTHECFLNPQTDVEKVYARLNNKLKIKREKHTDKAHPLYWLIVSDKNDLEHIIKELKIPDNYVDFLAKASPLNVEIKLRGYGLVELFGSDNLIEMQSGYSYNPFEDKKIEDWPENYVVIGSCMADPFCIDISQENSPIYHAQHGMNEWNFEVIYPTLLDFLKALG